MEGIVRFLARTRSWSALYAAAFFLWLHLFFVGYVNSTFAAGIAGETGMGMLFAAGSLLAILAHSALSRSIAAFGNFRTAIALTTAEFAALATLALSPAPLFSAAAFLAHVALVPLLLINFDVFVEEKTPSESVTGSVRGAILTVSNAAVLVAPLLIGLAAGEDNFARVYLGACAMLAVFFVLLLRFRNFKDPVYDRATLREIVGSVARHPDLRRTAYLYLLLRIFFTFMVIYTPLYLRTVLGFAWEEIGVMFTIMLLPLVLFELPFGKIADRFLGEKELLIGGFLVLAAATAAMAAIGTPSAALWTVALFASRVGAAAVEAMTETHFFRYVGAGSAGLIGFFRLAIPAATIATPLIATIVLAFAPMQTLFLVFGVLMLLGVVIASGIRDSK